MNLISEPIFATTKLSKTQARSIYVCLRWRRSRAN